MITHLGEGLRDLSRLLQRIDFVPYVEKQLMNPAANEHFRLLHPGPVQALADLIAAGNKNVKSEVIGFRAAQSSLVPWPKRRGRASPEVQKLAAELLNATYLATKYREKLWIDSVYIIRYEIEECLGKWLEQNGHAELAYPFWDNLDLPDTPVQQDDIDEAAMIHAKRLMLEEEDAERIQTWLEALEGGDLLAERVGGKKYVSGRSRVAIDMLLKDVQENVARRRYMRLTAGRSDPDPFTLEWVSTYPHRRVAVGDFAELLPNQPNPAEMLARSLDLVEADAQNIATGSGSDSRAPKADINSGRRSKQQTAPNAHIHFAGDRSHQASSRFTQDEDVEMDVDSEKPTDDVARPLLSSRNQDPIDVEMSQPLEDFEAPVVRIRTGEDVMREALGEDSVHFRK
ncbi:hypothetical protein BDN72DRAFT_907167 [Pluteus cervinus]|uniref:Uncharacterized protein n=1 Tax=Pluteus cervinus TaxID=181527 RepID=A0ACD2ZY20_9AGAR|nr:hypothetical protein BDN72DRAFT_907167 [Pluteus cervinus]